MKEMSLINEMIRNIRTLLPFINKGTGGDIISHQCDQIEAARKGMSPAEIRISTEILRQLVDHYLFGDTFNWEPKEDHDFKSEVVAMGMYYVRPKLHEKDLKRWEEVINKPYIIWESRQYASKEVADDWVEVW